MLNDIQYYITAFAQLTVASAFGLVLTIGVAGLTHADLPFTCKDCVQQMRG
jgi:hypothetical protein